jgi:hypothetical protein
MKKTFEPRYPTSNAGFIFIAISLFLSLVTVGFFVIVIGNQHRRGEAGDGTFNWVLAVITVVVGLVLFGAGVAGLRRLLRNEPRRVTLEDDRLLIERVPKRGQAGTVDAIIAYEQLISVNQQDNILANEAARGGARYKGLALEWHAAGQQEPASYYLSERDVVEFDQLMDELFARTPEPARGARIFDR